MTWSGIRDPKIRARIASGAPRPVQPLDEAAALERATLLYQRGWSCSTISDAMGVYHGQWATGSAWRMRLVDAGVITGAGSWPGARRGSRHMGGRAR